MSNVPEIFGSMVFNDETMRNRLPKETYKALKKTIDNGEPPRPLGRQHRRQRDEGLGL